VGTSSRSRAAKNRHPLPRSPNSLQEYGKWKLCEPVALAGPRSKNGISSRGAAFGDYDNDGSVEIVINNQNEPPSLLKLSHQPQGNWIILAWKERARTAALSDAGAGRKPATGFKVTKCEAEEATCHRMICADFGLGKAVVIDRLEINWRAALTRSKTGCQ